MVRSSSTYQKFRKSFDNLAKIVEKYNINGAKYVNFCVHDRCVIDPSCLLDANNIWFYGQELLKDEEYHKIYDLYRKSASNVAEDCLRFGYDNVVCYLRFLIENDKIAEQYISGRMSRYYIASFPNFDKLYEKMGRNSRAELDIISKTHNELNKDVQDAFLKLKNCHVSPVRYATEILKEKIRCCG